MFPPTTAPAQGLQSAEEVLHFASTSLGAIDQSVDLSLARSPHRIRLLATRSGNHVIAKWFDDSTSYFRSLDAMNHHTIPLGTQAPRLIAHDDRLKALLMTHLPGEVAGDDTARDPVTHFQVGTLLRQFHESSTPNPSAQATTDLASGLSLLTEELEDDLGQVLVAELRELGMQLLDLGPQPLQPVHGGIRPEHWMVDENYGVQLFSFSTSQYDPWIKDTLDLERQYWRYQPELKSAFFAGYDRAPSDSDELLLRGFLAQSALTSWAEVMRRSSTKKSRQLAWAEVEHTTGCTLF